MTKQYTKEEVLGKIKEIADIMEEYDIYIHTNDCGEISISLGWFGNIDTGFTCTDGEDLKEVLKELL